MEGVLLTTSSLIFIGICLVKFPVSLLPAFFLRGEIMESNIFVTTAAAAITTGAAAAAAAGITAASTAALIFKQMSDRRDE